MGHVDNFPTGSWSTLDQEIPQRIGQTIGSKKSMFIKGFSPAEFPMIDVMPQDIAFTAEYFIAHVSTPLHQHRMLLSQDATRRKLNLYFDNSRCHTARSVTDEIAKLSCKRVAHLPYPPDLAICDFYLFLRLKDKLTGFHADDDAELLREAQGILTAIDRTEVKNAFGHWIEQCQSVTTNTGKYYPE
jgi:histone-lysine N-methyltransferase SETMAR